MREHSVAFALVAHAWMPGIDTLAKALDLITADFTYVRFIGDRRRIENKTKRFDKVIEDKTEELSIWVDELKKIVNKGEKLLQSSTRISKQFMVMAMRSCRSV